MSDQQPTPSGWGPQQPQPPAYGHPQPYGPPGMPPQPPKKSHTTRNVLIIVAGVLVGLLLLVGGCTAMVAGLDEATDDTKATAKDKEGAKADAKDGEQGAGDPADSGADGTAGDGTATFDQVVEYEDGIKVEVSGFSRATSSEFAVPEKTPYAKFTVKLTNGSDDTLDSSLLMINCAYGDDGRQSEQIFDTENGLDEMLTTHVRPGRSISTTVGCELPKEESYLQIEVTPGFGSETAVFADKVK